jgi:hypothetical protein
VAAVASVVAAVAVEEAVASVVVVEEVVAAVVVEAAVVAAEEQVQELPRPPTFRPTVGLLAST